MRWMRNGKEVTTDVNYSDVMPNGDWCYQTHSHLKYIPTSAEKIACMVEHPGLSEPMFVVWGKFAAVMPIKVREIKLKLHNYEFHFYLTVSDPSLPVEQQTQIAVGVCGLVIGFVIAISRIIYCITVRQSKEFVRSVHNITYSDLKLKVLVCPALSNFIDFVPFLFSRES